MATASTQQSVNHLVLTAQSVTIVLNLQLHLLKCFLTNAQQEPFVNRHVRLLVSQHSVVFQHILLLNRRLTEVMLAAKTLSVHLVQFKSSLTSLHRLHCKTLVHLTCPLLFLFRPVLLTTFWQSVQGVSIALKELWELRIRSVAPSEPTELTLWVWMFQIAVCVQQVTIVAQSARLHLWFVQLDSFVQKELLYRLHVL